MYDIKQYAIYTPLHDLYLACDENYEWKSKGGIYNLSQIHFNNIQTSIINGTGGVLIDFILDGVGFENVLYVPVIGSAGDLDYMGSFKIFDYEADDLL